MLRPDRAAQLAIAPLGAAGFVVAHAGTSALSVPHWALLIVTVAALWAAIGVGVAAADALLSGLFDG
ncbi:hypothetical protein [Halegenticoccus soli]|uniref:hypothetical protein n=1 Tax=Halegenticoccus soli TaxID=1985678 RepID=UPI000C6D2F9C|nr:hypothetical protein [Halegenticoccus soli]